MKDFKAKLAVITGAGTGMGRELARQLAAEGCHLALCDVQLETLARTRELCLSTAPEHTRVTIHRCDVSSEDQLIAFRDAALREHASSSVQLLFNNAGIGGGGSFVLDSRADWERTFGVCWGGVYLGCRVFLPALMASEQAHIINTSSVNGFWACLGPKRPHTAYSSAKFAVKGFTEGLRVDLRLNAPHVKVSLVMPGHVGTSIMENSMRILRERGIEQMTAEDLAPMRKELARLGIDPAAMSDDQMRAGLQQFSDTFRDRAPLSAAAAARIILDGVREERWRILVGADAEAADQAVRQTPEDAYEIEFAVRLRDSGHFGGMGG